MIKIGLLKAEKQQHKRGIKIDYHDYDPDLVECTQAQATSALPHNISG